MGCFWRKCTLYSRSHINYQYLSWYVALWIRGAIYIENPSRYLFCAGYVAIHFLGFTYFSEDYLSYLTPFGSLLLPDGFTESKTNHRGHWRKRRQKSQNKYNSYIYYTGHRYFYCYTLYHSPTASLKKECHLCAGPMLSSRRKPFLISKMEYTVRLYYHTAGTEKFIWDLMRLLIQQ